MLDVSPGDPQFGKALKCPKCGPPKDQERLEALCGLTEEMRAWKFDNTMRRAGIAPAFDELRARVPDARQGRSPGQGWFVTLMGEYGVGKTRLLSCAVNAGREAGLLSVYTTTALFLDALMETFGHEPGVETFSRRWDLFTRADILAVDEFDRFNPTPWAESRFSQLVDERYRRGAESLTIFATNGDLIDFPRYLASRLADKRSKICRLTGADMRQIRE